MQWHKAIPAILKSAFSPVPWEMKRMPISAILLSEWLIQRIVQILFLITAHLILMTRIFLTKFILGKLDYFLSVDEYNNFLQEYVEDKRSVYEQELKLNCQQKQTIIKALQNNLQGNNRYYKYDFLFDNCTTRVRDIIFNYVKAAYTH